MNSSLSRTINKLKRCAATPLGAGVKNPGAEFQVENRDSWLFIDKWIKR